MPEVSELVSPRLHTIAEAAQILNLSRWSLYQMTSSGVLPCVRTGPCGRTVRITETDLREYLARARSSATRAVPVVPDDGTPTRRKAAR